MHNNRCVFVILEGETVESDTIDPKIHKFIGLFRHPVPPDNSYIDSFYLAYRWISGNGDIAYINCPKCYSYGYPKSKIELFDCYQKGHFDIPQYITIK